VAERPGVIAGDARHQRVTQILLTGSLLVVSMALGLAGQALIAYYFGAGTRSDSLFLARDIGDLAAKVLMTTQAVGVLVPLIVSLRHSDGPKASDRALAAVLTAVLAAGTLVAVLVGLLARPLVVVLAPGFDDVELERSVGLLRLVAPMTPFVAVAALAAGALQARHRFGRAMVASIVGSAAVLVAMPPLVSVWGIEGAALATTLGVVAQALCAWGFLLAEGVPPVIAPWRARKHVMEFVRRTAPFISYAAATQASGAVLRVAASLLGTGLYTAFSLAYRLYRSLLTIMIIPVQQVLLPALSHSEAGGRSDGSAAELISTLRYVSFALTPVTVVVAALAQPIVSAVFERGEFSAGNADSTAIALAVFALALLPSALYFLLEQAAYARRRTSLIVRVNLSIEAIQAGLYVPGVLLLGIAGIPAAGVLAALFAAGSYLYQLRPGPLRAHSGFALRLVIAAAVMAAATLAAAAAVDAALHPAAGLAQVVIIVPAGLAGLVVYFVAAQLIGLREGARLFSLLKAFVPSR
jgi:putative peptidoglycan lipid II flippase